MYHLWPKHIIYFPETGFWPENPASLHQVLTSVTFLGGNMTQWSVNSMLNSVFSDLCVDYGPGNDTVVLRSPVKSGMNWNAGVFQELADYPLSLSTLTLEGGDLHWRLLHWGRRLTIRLRSEEDECRLYTINAWHARHISRRIAIYLLFLVSVLFALTSDIYAKNNHSDYYTLSDWFEYVNIIQRK